MERAGHPHPKQERPYTPTVHGRRPGGDAPDADSLASQSKCAPEQSFGSELRRLRLLAGLSQEILAERAGLSTASIAAYERGRRRRPYPNTLACLATALDLAPAERAALMADGSA